MSSAITLQTGARLGLVGRVAITRQDNDLTKPDSTQNAFTTTFTLVDSAEVHKALEHAAEGTSTSTLPYRQLPGTLETDGVELIPRALLQVQAYEPRVGYTAQVFGGNKSFYTALGDKKISELDLSKYNHDWTPANIFAGLNSGAADYRRGYCYDLVDRGKGDPCVWTPATGNAAGFYTLDAYAGECYPSAYVRAVWDQIFIDAGFSWRGTLPESFNRATLPATKPYGYGSDTRDGYAILAGWRHKLSEQIREDGGDWYRDAPFNYTGDATFKKGKNADFNPATGKATIKIPGYYNIGGKVKVRLGCDSWSPGRVRCSIYLHVNGQQIAQDYLTTGSEAEDIIEARFEGYRLNAGDVVSVHLRGEELTNAYGPTGTYWRIGGGLNLFTYPRVDETITETVDDSFEVTLLEQFPTGGLINLADWLPDLTQKDFIKAFVEEYALQQRPDPYLDVIEFEPVNQLFGNLAAAEVLDARIDNGRPSKVSYQLSGFGQKSWCRWKPDTANGDAAQYLGDGFLTCPDTSLDASKDLFTLPFAASPAGANGLVLLPRWQADANSDPVTYSDQAIEPRQLLRSTTRSRVVTFRDDSPSNTTPAPTPTVVGTATIPLAYFASTNEPVDLDFGRTLLPTYYTVLAAALVAPRVIKPFVRLAPDDVVNFNQLVPVWIEREGSYFYQNKIEQYEEGNSTTAVELIRLSI
jgi:hypothetical protein